MDWVRGGVDLAWSSQAATGAVGYRILRSDAGCGGPFAEIGFTREPTVTYRGVPSAAGTYGYVIRAVPVLGTPCGADSVCVSATWGCVSGSPGVTANSVRVTRSGGNAGIEWLSAGAGRWNVHRTADRAALGALFQDAASIIATVDLPQATDTAVTAPGEIGFYQAYGADGCTGESVP